MIGGEVIADMRAAGRTGINETMRSEPLTKPTVFHRGTGILPVFHGRDAHATRGLFPRYTAPAV